MSILPCRKQMTSSFLILLILVAFGSAPLLASSPDSNKARTLSKKDREFATQRLNASKKKLLDAISGLSEAQWNFKPSPLKWSIAETAEHLVLAEDTIFSLVTERILKTPAAEDGVSSKVENTAIFEAATDRSRRFQAPAVIRPKQKWETKDDLIKEFEKRRARTIAYVESTSDELHGHFLKNALFKDELDAFQWLLFAAAHNERHMAQINEVKANPNFPM